MDKKIHLFCYISLNYKKTDSIFLYSLFSLPYLRLLITKYIRTTVEENISFIKSNILDLIITISMNLRFCSNFIVT